MSSGSSRLGEFAMIAKLFAPLAAKTEGAFGLLDNVALLRVPPATSSWQRSMRSSKA